MVQLLAFRRRICTSPTKWIGLKSSNAALDLRTRDRERKLLQKIEAALRRIEEGNYGYCVETDEPINLRRLEARPIASLSLHAQERHERMERVHRDD